MIVDFPIKNIAAHITLLILPNRNMIQIPHNNCLYPTNETNIINTCTNINIYKDLSLLLFLYLCYSKMPMQLIMSFFGQSQ